MRRDNGVLRLCRRHNGERQYPNPNSRDFGETLLTRLRAGVQAWGDPDFWLDAVGLRARQPDNMAKSHRSVPHRKSSANPCIAIEL